MQKFVWIVLIMSAMVGFSDNVNIGKIEHQTKDGNCGCGGRPK